MSERLGSNPEMAPGSSPPPGSSLPPGDRSPPSSSVSAPWGPPGYTPYRPPPATPPPAAFGPWHLAGWGYRAAAYLVDCTLAVLGGAAAGGIAALVGASADAALGIAFFGIVLWWPLQMATVMAITGGQTPGKKLVGLRVIRESGHRAGFGWSILRDTLSRGLFALIPFGNLLNYLWPLGDRGRQALHDKLAATRVVHAVAERRLGAAVGGAVVSGIATLGLTAALVAVVLSIDVDDTGPPGDYTSLERAVYIDSCSEDGDPRAECACQFDRIAATIPHDTFLDYADRVGDDPKTPPPPGFVEAIDGCT